MRFCFIVTYIFWFCFAFASCLGHGSDSTITSLLVNNYVQIIALNFILCILSLYLPAPNPLVLVFLSPTLLIILLWFAITTANSMNYFLRIANKSQPFLKSSTFLCIRQIDKVGWTQQMLIYD